MKKKEIIIGKNLIKNEDEEREMRRTWRNKFKDWSCSVMMTEIISKNY